MHEINTMFRQAFLLSQYSFIYVQYFKCSDNIINAIFLWNIVFILGAKISSKKSLWKIGKQLNIGKGLTSV